MPDPITGPKRSKGIDRSDIPGVRAPFPARVWGRDTHGRQFEVESRIDNISSGVMCLDLPRKVAKGEHLLAVVEFLTAPGGVEDLETRHPRVAVWGPVERCQRWEETWKTVVHFHGHVIA